MMKKSFGFTLGEILIALGVIGIVATLVIPQLVSGHKTNTAKAQFNTAYAMLSKAITEMEADDIPVEPSKYSSDRTKLYEELKKYNKVTYDCGTIASGNPNTSICPSNRDYKIYKKNSSTNIYSSSLNKGCFVVNNGMLVCVGSILSQTLISVDINGKNKKPNKWGYDLFTFQLVEGGHLLPFGNPYSMYPFSEPERYCQNEDTNNVYSGCTCAQFAVSDEEYFKKLYKGH